LRPNDFWEMTPWEFSLMSKGYEMKHEDPKDRKKMSPREISANIESVLQQLGERRNQLGGK
jgi:hypothetical protein